MKNRIILAFLWVAFCLHGQTADTMFTPKLTGRWYISEAKYIGNIFFNKQWTESSILLSTGEKVEGEHLKYNGFLDEVIWLNRTNFLPFVLDRNHIRAFYTTDSLQRPVHFKRLQLSNNKDVYVQVIVQNRYSLFIQRKVVNLPSEIVSGTNGNYYCKAYGQMPVYYIQTPTGQLLTLKSISRRNVLQLFPEQKETLTALIRKHGIRLRTEEGLKAFVERIND